MPSSVVRPLRLALSLAVVACLAGCRRQPESTGGVAAPSPGLARSVGKSVTEAEAVELADEFEETAIADDLAAFNRLIDWPTVDLAATAGIDAPADVRANFAKGLAKSHDSDQGVPALILKTVRDGGSFTLLHSHTKDDRRWLLFRLLEAQGGLNYYDIPLARRSDGKVRGVDLYVYTDSELQSQRFRRGFIQALNRVSGSFLNRLTGEDRKWAKHYQTLIAMGVARKDEHFGEVIRLYHAAPPEFQKDKVALQIRLDAARKIDDEAEYLAALNDLLTLFPNDAAADLLAIDSHTRKKRFAEALACVDRVDRAVQGDPYLHTLRAGIHMEQGDLAAARADANRAIAEAPDLNDSYWSLVSVDLQANDHAATLRDLRTLRDRFHTDFGDLTEQEAYKAFTQSPQYQDWLRDQPASKSEPSVSPPPADPKT